MLLIACENHPLQSWQVYNRRISKGSVTVFDRCLTDTVLLFRMSPSRPHRSHRINQVLVSQFFQACYCIVQLIIQICAALTPQYNACLCSNLAHFFVVGRHLHHSGPACHPCRLPELLLQSLDILTVQGSGLFLSRAAFFTSSTYLVCTAAGS